MEYDPFFAPSADLLNRDYDFITCTEVIEHFFEPAREFQRLDRLLRPGGWIGLMSEFYTEERPVAGWRYARDPTHVCFYRAATLEWIAKCHGWSVEHLRNNVAILRKGD